MTAASRHVCMAAGSHQDCSRLLARCPPSLCGLMLTHLFVLLPFAAGFLDTHPSAPVPRPPQSAMPSRHGATPADNSACCVAVSASYLAWPRVVWTVCSAAPLVVPGTVLRASAWVGCCNMQQGCVLQAPCATDNRDPETQAKQSRPFPLN